MIDRFSVGKGGDPVNIAARRGASAKGRARRSGELAIRPSPGARAFRPAHGSQNRRDFASRAFVVAMSP